MGYTHRRVAENTQTTVYERTDKGLFGWGILAAGSKDYVAIENQTGSAVSGSTVGEARVKLEQFSRAVHGDGHSCVSVYAQHRSPHAAERQRNGHAGLA